MNQIQQAPALTVVALLELHLSDFQTLHAKLEQSGASADDLETVEEKISGLVQEIFDLKNGAGK